MAVSPGWAASSSSHVNPAAFSHSTWGHGNSHHWSLRTSCPRGHPFKRDQARKQWLATEGALKICGGRKGRERRGMGGQRPAYRLGICTYEHKRRTVWKGPYSQLTACPLANSSPPWALASRFRRAWRGMPWGHSNVLQAWELDRAGRFPSLPTSRCSILGCGRKKGLEGWWVWRW